MRSSSFGPARLHVRRGEKPRGGLADDFFRSKTEDAFCAGVPAQDTAGRIEHEDRIILHVVGHQGKAFFFFKGLLVQLGVLDSGGGAAGQVIGQVQVGRAEAAARFGGHQRQGPQRAAAAD